MENTFLFCSYAVAVWDEVKNLLDIKLRKKEFTNMRDWIFLFLERATPVQATALAVTSWHIWDARNDAKNGISQLHPFWLANKIKVYVENIIQHCYKPSAPKRCESPSVLKWTPPPCGQVCVNVDAAIFHSDNRMGWGAVWRDHTGSLSLVGLQQRNCGYYFS
jgi:hypothetical protein